MKLSWQMGSPGQSLIGIRVRLVISSVRVPAKPGSTKPAVAWTISPRRPTVPSEKTEVGMGRMVRGPAAHHDDGSDLRNPQQLLIVIWHGEARGAAADTAVTRGAPRADRRVRAPAVQRASGGRGVDGGR